VLGLGCGVYLLLFRLVRFGGHAFRQWIFWVVLLMVLLTAVGEFAMQPILAGLKDQALPLQVMESVFRDRFAAWHGVASLLYLIECALGVVLVLLQESAPR
jgi:ABC-type spermidine/putrescine transport system permease subunit I